MHPASFQRKKKNNRNSMVDSIGASITEKLHGRRNVYAILTNLVYSIQSVIACRSRAVETHSLEFFSFALVLCARTKPVRFIRYPRLDKKWNMLRSYERIPFNLGPVMRTIPVFLTIFKKSCIQIFYIFKDFSNKSMSKT